MVIQHNIPAINSHRALGVNNTAAAKNLEKLSSGFKINRAGDDAAGLAISEKMRTAINGLSKAEDNTSNAINLIQTAEGGMQELHSILQKMSELATQATNGTYANDVDREALDLEFQQLKEEFNRIRDYTNYNGIKLLNGTPYGEDPSAASAKEITSLDQIVKGATGIISATSSTANGETTGTGAKIENAYIDIVFATDGSIDLTNTKVYNSDGTAFTDVRVTKDASTGNLIVHFDNAGGTKVDANGSFRIDGDWLQDPVTKGLHSAKITFSADAVGTANEAGHNRNFTITDITANAGDSLTDVFAAAKIPTANPGTGAISYTGNTLTQDVDVDINLIFENGVLNVKATNDALAEAGIHGIKVSLDAGNNNELLIAIVDPSDPAGTTNKVTYKIEGDWSGAVATATKDISNVNLKFTAAALDADYYGSGSNNSAGFVHGSGYQLTITAGKITPGVSDGNPVGQRDTGDYLVFQVGDRGTADQQVRLKIADVAADQLGAGTDLSKLTNLGEIDADGEASGTYTLETYGGVSYDIDITDAETYEMLTVEDMHILDKNSANIAIEVVKTAVDDLSMRRAELGAVQNRLEHTLSNLGVTKENLTASESTIRDVDMAKEMMEFTKNSILIQSAQAMLAQANTLPQGVLQLLR